jgi:outer membrane lipoprotein-sorting protein
MKYALLLLLGMVSAQTGTGLADITRQVKTNLEKSPWEASMVGKIQLPDGTVQDADFKIQVIPQDSLVRAEFKKPNALEGNFVIVSAKEVWNYLFLTNQLIIQPRAKAKVEGLGINLTNLGDFDGLTEGLATKLTGEETTPEGPVWKILGTAKNQTQGYATMELKVLKSDPRPTSIVLKDQAGKVVASFSLKDFKRPNLTAKVLKKYPSDAEVIKK